jgi:polyhydroxyalkanoate synthesis regulator phasin
MMDAIRKTLLAGLGAAVITKEKAEAVLSDLVKQGKINSADARIMADKIVEQGRREFDEMGGKVRDFVRQSDSKVQARIDGLEDRIRELEAKMAATPPRRRTRTRASS